MNNARKPKTASPYKTYWLINGKRYDSEHTMTQRVLAGATAIEVSADAQKAAAEQQEQLHKQALAEQDRTYRAAMQRQSENSPEGKREAAIRFAAQNPGGVVTLASANDNFAELDSFSRDNTNVFKR